ncbi:MAG: cytochrome D1 domain-containing protein, partial [Chromatiaceae bacterium]
MAPLRLLLVATLATGLSGPLEAADTNQASDSAPPVEAVPEGPAALYQRLCAQCHGADRLGITGPALIPENFGRLKPEEALGVILNGRPASQMLGFADRLSEAEAQSLVDLVYQPLPESPTWGLDRIEGSRQVLVQEKDLPHKPLHGSDPLNLFVVVETGDHHATILDGDRLEPIHRFATRRALHGGPKFSPDGRFVYFASRDGWISKFDLYGLKTVAEVRAGIHTRNLAVSGDGRYVAVANYLPHTLLILDARDLAPLKLIPVQDDTGKGSRVSAVYAAPPRQSFVAALKDIPEVWEILVADDPLPVYNGPMHDYRMGEGTALEPGPFPVRRTRLDDYLDDFFFDQSYQVLIGAARDGKNGQVVNLDVRRKIAELDLDGMPHLGSGITWERDGHTLLATPHLEKPEVSVIDLATWKTVRRIQTLGPGFFMRSHESSPYAWVDVFSGPDRDAMHVIDKQTLEIVATLRPAPGKTAAHVEFDRYGRYALVSIWEDDGAIVVFDAKTLKEVKRLPMKKPSGKYNVYNKITRSEGTSH